MDLKLVLKALQKNHFDGRLVWDKEEARVLILELIPASAKVGVGDSATVRQLGLIEALAKRGNPLLNPFVPELTQGMRKDAAVRRRFMDTARRALDTDVFITSANAVTQDGKLVSIDYTGNRVAGVIFGPRRVVLVVGRNKLVKDIEEAVFRIKNVIVPAHTKFRGRKTPCAATGACTDCSSPDRICNIMVILEKKPSDTEVIVVLIDDDLGLGWDPSWEKARIDCIHDNYCKSAFVMSQDGE